MSRIRTFALSGVALLALSTGAFADSNSVYLNQADSGNVATIVQSGSNNEAGTSSLSVTQSSGLGGTGANKLDVEQSGTFGKVGRITAGNFAGETGATQRGSGNALTIRQSGQTNQIAYSQYGNNPSTLPSPIGALLDPSLVPATGWNTVTQGGSDNHAVLRQGRNDGTGTNTGNENNAAVIVDQSGTSNNLSIGQASGSFNVAYVKQNGASGIVTLNQSGVNKGTAGGFADNFNFSDLQQGGTSNQLYADQRGSSDRQSASQEGTGNFFLSRQNATGSTMKSTQTGDGSIVLAYQGATFPAGRANTSDFDIDLLRTGKGNPGWNDKDPLLTSGSSLTVTQSASQSIVAFSQMGTGEMAILTQGGTNNGIYGYQMGMNQSAYLTQDGGSNNSIFLAQTGGGASVQVATISQGVANNNFASSVQSGSGNRVTVSQNR